MKKKYMKIISFLLSIIMIICTVPISATSADIITSRLDMSETVSLNSAKSISSTTVTNANTRQSADKWNSVEEASTIDNASKIVYNNVVNNTDLEYVLDGNDIKENIIINKSGGSYNYKFEISLDGLVASLNENGTVLLVQQIYELMNLINSIK